jgi:sialate O-acetylesterase
MILQRDTKVRIWGWASPGENIAVSIHQKKYSCVADPGGKWSLFLDPVKAGGPYEMQIDASNHITVRDIFFGEVWVCSGQSNMVIPMERVKEKYPYVIAQAGNFIVRQFFVPNRYVFTTPQQDFSAGNWESANPETVLHFTAVGYFFAKSLYEKYHVPIGLINASVGGTPVESWMSEDALKNFPSALESAEQCRDSNYVQNIIKQDNNIRNGWYDLLWEADKGLHEEKKWFDPGYSASNWPVMQLPGFWSDQGLGNVNGVVWFRKEIDLPDQASGKGAKLLLGRIVDQDSVYINGRFVGTTGYQYPPRRYDVPAGVLKGGKNIIVVRVINSSGKGGFIKDKPYRLTVDGQTIDLKGEWKYQLGTIANPLPAPTFFQYKPLGEFNAMIAPLINYSIKGVIWYQGESNASKPDEYAKFFAALIKDWRQKWNQGNFPFLYVQLANFMETKSQPAESSWATLREAQLEVLKIPNTAMAVAIDIGEWNDVHPLDKEDVGKRLALAAEKIAYGEKKTVYSGPIYHSMKIEGNKIILSFTNTGTGLVAKDANELKYFSIAGADKKFVWASAEIKGDQVIAWSDSIPSPVAVRYAWADNPEGANLYNKEGLPASPFSTDE